MSILTEIEIFDCLRTNFRLAAEHCEDLAVKPRKGPIYKLLREELKLIEGAARQAAHWREDSRFLDIAKRMGEAHRLAGNWLRGIKVGRGPRRKIPEGQRHPMFMALAAALRALSINCENLRTHATGRVGIILPDVLPGPRRDTRPVAVRLPPGMVERSSGLVVPQGLH